MTVAEQPSVQISIFAPRYRLASSGLLILISMIAFESMAVAPALPTAARELHGLNAYGWAFTAFLVANVVGMVLAGQLCDARGPRTSLIGGMLLFLLGLLVAGTAATMTQLIGARAVQGLGAGLLITAVYVVIGETYSAQLRPTVFAAISSAWLLPSLFGPLASGSLTQHVGWRWVFLGLLPFVVIGSLLMIPVLRSMVPRPEVGRVLAEPRRLALALLVALGIAAIELAGQHPSAPVLALAGAGLAALVVGLRGLLPPGTFTARPGVPAPIALRGLLAGSLFGAEALVPLMLTQQHGIGATAAGLPLAGAGVVWGMGSWWQQRSSGGRDPHRYRAKLLRSGFLLVAVAVASIAVVALPATPWWLAFPGWACGGLGAGLAMTTASVLVLEATTDADRGRDSAALQLADVTASALTTGLAGVLVAAAVRSAISYTAAFIVLDAVLVVLALVGAALSGRVRTASPTPSP